MSLLEKILSDTMVFRNEGMSINDMLNEDIPPEVFIIVGITVLIGVIFLLIACSKVIKQSGDIYGSNDIGAVRSIDNAKVLICKISPHPLNNANSLYTVIFELEDGERLSFAIKDINTYNLFVEGDVGTLCFQGKRLISFERN